jgi:hypothetical protein
MKLRMTLVMGLAIFSLGLLPAAGMADGPDYTPEGPKYNPDHPTTPQGPKSAPKGKAYGYYCRAESKKHVKGVKGTAFSNCVKALAQADKNDSLTARKACKAQKNAAGKHKAHGEKGTAFSRCIKAVNQMRREQNATVATSSVA